MKTPTLIANILMLGVLITQPLNAEQAAKESLGVSIKPLDELLIDSKQSAPASVVSLNSAVVSAEITGRATKIYAKMGDMIEAGQKLVELDCRSYNLAKKQAQAALKVSITQRDLARKQLKRNRRLIAKGTIPRELLENSEAAEQTSLADIELKKAQIETAALAIKRCTIRAPFTAQITQRMVQQDQLLMPGTPLFRLMQRDNMEVTAQLAPNKVADLKNAPLIEFLSESKRYPINLRSVIQQVDETTRTQELRLSLPANTEIPAGLAGRIEWRDQQRKIPPEFIRRYNGQLGVMIVDESAKPSLSAKFQPLPEAVEGQPAPTHLAAETLVINKNRYRVNHGDSIQIQN